MTIFSPEKVLSMLMKGKQWWNMKQCNDLQSKNLYRKVEKLELLIQSVKQRDVDTYSEATKEQIQELCEIVTSSQNLLTRYSDQSSFNLYLRGSSFDSEFKTIDRRLNEAYTSLNLALQNDGPPQSKIFFGYTRADLVTMASNTYRFLHHLWRRK